VGKIDTSLVLASNGEKQNEADATIDIRRPLHNWDHGDIRKAG